MLNKMNAIVDTHAHLCDPAFDSDLEAVLERALGSGVKAIVAVSEDLQDAAKNLKLASRYPVVRPAAGLYPTILNLELASQMQDFIRTNRNRLVAIGEVGLDYWKVQDEAQREIQREIFHSFIALSGELGLPLNVHSRSAGRQAIEVLMQAGARKVQMHAFDGKVATALAAAEAGFFFSIPPSLLRSEQKRKLVKGLPITSLLIETDSPVLGPSAQERNEPANAALVARAIAEIKQLDEAEVVMIVQDNTRRLYPDF